jgi:hypothetical protein
MPLPYGRRSSTSTLFLHSQLFRMYSKVSQKTLGILVFPFCYPLYISLFTQEPKLSGPEPNLLSFYNRNHYFGAEKLSGDPASRNSFTICSKNSYLIYTVGHATAGQKTAWHMADAERTCFLCVEVL